MKKILVVDDNITICLMLRSWLLKHNYEVDTASSVAEAIEKVKKYPYDLILSDIIMPEDDGFSLLGWVQKYDSYIQVIMMTSFADIESAVESIKLGAVDYIAKPIDADVLFQKIEDAFRRRDISLRSKGLQQYLVSPKDVETERLHGEMIDVIRNGSHLLVMGKEGTGKTTAAKFIYINGAKERGAYIEYDLNQSNTDIAKLEINEGDLFSYYFDKAKGGLLHIKNLKKVDLPFQTSLIRALNNQSKNDDYTQIIISSTYSQEEIKEHFMPKLSERLLELYIELPSLANRKDAIVSYSEFFLNMANNELSKNVENIPSEAYKLLFEQKWEGNIQQLKNLIFKMVLLSDNGEISKDIIDRVFNDKKESVLSLGADNDKSLDSFKKENFEKKKITEALEIAKGNKTLAATLLNIDRKTLYNKIRLYNIV